MEYEIDRGFTAVAIHLVEQGAKQKSEALDLQVELRFFDYHYN